MVRWSGMLHRPEDAMDETSAVQSRRRAVEFLRHGGEALHTTRVEAIAAWGRKNSLAHYPFAGACCAVEYQSTTGPRFDLDRWGGGPPRTSPRHADLLMVVGTITHRMARFLKRVYAQMPEPKWVMAFGSCTCSGGPYDNYAVVQGIATLVPVDI